MARVWTARRWGITLLAACIATVIVSFRNFFGYRLSGRSIPLWEVMAAEIPVWLGWAMLLPLIVRVALRFPPLGPHVVRNTVLHLGVGLLLAGVVILFTVAWRTLLPTVGAGGPPGMPFLRFVGEIYLLTSLGFLFIYGTIVGLTLAWRYHREQQERRTRESQLEALLARAQRDLLRTQIHPHFLFNTLHAISALMSTQVPAARRMIARLSELLRASLDTDSEHETTLEEEIDFLSRYVDIQQIRFGERMSVRYDIEPATRRLLLPRLMLQILVENAIIHGLERVEHAVTITIRSRLDGDELVIDVTDNGPGPGAEPRAGRGLGLSNSRARLEQLYGHRAALTLQALPRGGTRADLRLPAHEHPAYEEESVS